MRDEARATSGARRGGSRLVALALLSIAGAFGLGWGVISVVDALEPVDGCGPYGGYGCEPPDDATITVVPSTDLVDRQVVLLTGAGFAPNTTFGVAQCDPSAGPDAGIDGCDLSTAQTTSTDQNGEVQLAHTVRRIITVGGREIDCALSPCTLGAATLDGLTPIEVATAPISFDPTVPPVPRLAVSLSVEDITVEGVSGTVTCNRLSEVFIDASVQQQKGPHQSFAYGYSDAPLACDTTPTSWSIRFVGGSGFLTAGQVSYDVFASAYDGFESGFAEESGTAMLSGGGRPSVDPIASPGDTVSVEVTGTSSGTEGLTVDLRVVCDRPVPMGFAWVAVSQRVGLETVDAFGSVDFGPCDGATDVSVPVTELNGTLAGGPAVVRADVQIADLDPPDEEFFDYASVIAAVRLQGTERPALQVQPNPLSRIKILRATTTELVGTVTCEEPALVELFTELQQSKGRTQNSAYGFEQIPCDGATAFAIPLHGDLNAGSAAAFVYATAYREIEGEPGQYEFLWDDQQAASLRVRG